MTAALATLPGTEPDPWEQRPDESTEEFGAFLDWLEQGTERGAPPPGAPTIRHEWAERALAYERACDLATADASGATPEIQIVSNLTRLVQLEAAKLLRHSAQEMGPTVSLKDLLATVGLIKDLQLANVGGATRGTGDMSRLTQEEKQIILQAQLLQRKAQK